MFFCTLRMPPRPFAFILNTFIMLATVHATPCLAKSPPRRRRQLRPTARASGVAPHTRRCSRVKRCVLIRSSELSGFYGKIVSWRDVIDCATPSRAVMVPRFSLAPIAQFECNFSTLRACQAPKTGAKKSEKSALSGGAFRSGCGAVYVCFGERNQVLERAAPPIAKSCPPSLR
jgi:hypothetical protein